MLLRRVDVCHSMFINPRKTSKTCGAKCQGQVEVTEGVVRKLQGNILFIDLAMQHPEQCQI